MFISKKVQSNMRKEIHSENEALALLAEETGKDTDQMDMDLIKDCLYYLYPEDEEADRAYIERTLPILHDKLGFTKPKGRVRHGRLRIAVAAALATAGTLMTASVIALALGLNPLNFFVEGTDEYWMLHMRTSEQQTLIESDAEVYIEDYYIWGEALVQILQETGTYPRLPKDMPKEYEFVEVIDLGKEPFYWEYKFRYENNQGDCFYLILREIGKNDTSDKIQTEPGDRTIENQNGVSVFYSQNYGVTSATWISQGCRVRIITEWNQAALIEIMSSI